MDAVRERYLKKYRDRQALEEAMEEESKTQARKKRFYVALSVSALFAIAFFLWCWMDDPSSPSVIVLIALAEFIGMFVFTWMFTGPKGPEVPTRPMTSEEAMNLLIISRLFRR